ncbi:nucleoside-diphosphate-sugar epimerase [Pseudomonas sp. TE6288]
MQVYGKSNRGLAVGECLLITGATGFIGGAVAAQLIAEGCGSQLCFLVRAATPEQGLQRLLANLYLHGLDGGSCRALSPAQIICGDLLDRSWLECTMPRLMKVDRVIHCAAVSSLSKSPSLWPVNVEGTFAFAEVMSNSLRLKRFVHVGAAMSCGFGCASPVSESWHFPDAQRQLAPSLAAKAEVERRMRKALPGLPLLTARPSMVVGHRRLGCQASGSLFWLYRMAFMLECFTCERDQKLDVIPVDYCAEVLIALAIRPHLAHDLYHICAGIDGTCAFADIDRAFALVCGTEPAGERCRQRPVDDLHALAGSLKSMFGPSNARRILCALRRYSRFATLGYVFDNSRLLDEGFTAPPCFTDYIDVCVESSKGVPITEQMQWDFK